MKRFSFSIVIVLLVFLVGCSNVFGPDMTGPGGWMDGVPSDHNVVLGIGVSNSEGPSQSVLPGSWAAENANAYTLVIYDEDNVYFGNLFSNTGVISLSVPEGTYNGVLVGGRKPNSQQPDAYVFGSQRFEDIVVEYGERTELTFSLETVSSYMWAPPEIAYGTSTYIEFSYRLGGAHDNLNIPTGTRNDWVIHQVFVADNGVIESYATSGVPSSTLTPEIFTSSSHTNYVVPIDVAAQNAAGNTDPSEIHFRPARRGIRLNDADMGYIANTSFLLATNSVGWYFPAIENTFDYHEEFVNNIVVPVVAESELTIGIDWVTGQ